jgi:hypothetical protein
VALGLALRPTGWRSLSSTYSDTSESLFIFGLAYSTFDHYVEHRILKSLVFIIQLIERP